jgi:hypothetical protein
VAETVRRLRPVPDLQHAARVPKAGRGPAAEEINVTERDVAALTWLGEQYAARGDVLRVLLARLGVDGDGQLAERTLRHVTERWAKAGLATRHRLLGHQWVVPTKKALHLVGLEYPFWSPVAPRLNHVHAVGIVRLAVEPHIPNEGRWVSERELKRDHTKVKVFDGAIELPEDADTRPLGKGTYGEELARPAPRIGVEVELFRKSGLRVREGLTRARNGRYLRTIYYAPPEVASFLEGQIAQANSPYAAEVRPLPQVDGTTYGGAQ